MAKKKRGGFVEMKEFIITIVSAYLFMATIAIFIGNIARIEGNNCHTVVADYVFLGLTRLPCEVK